MSKKNIIISLVVAVIVVVGLMYYQNSTAPAVPLPPVDGVTPTPVSSDAPVVATSVAPVVKRREFKITFLADAYSPKELTIKKGDTVTWVNNGDRKTWPASAVHPSHKNYPGSGIEKCNTSAEATIFDACRGIEIGKSYSFSFNEVGSWGYHDHLQASVFGKITVTE
ncbi:MAG: hypothetical protein Q8L47_04125 [bacterium]|nr:hypothetical protein [bacterium]